MKNLFINNKIKKSEFLDGVKAKYEEATYELYKKLLFKIDEFETYKGISAISMTKGDFLELLTSLNSTSLSVLYTYKSLISNYLVFITDTSRFKIGLLELNKITKEDLEDCINTRAEERQFITEEEYYELLEDAEDGKFNGNYQDKLILVLLWNKIKGERSYSEILDIKEDDIDFDNNTINLADRQVEITDFEMEIVKKAIFEKKYVKTTVNKDHTITRSEMDYVVTDYLVKSTAGSRNANVDTDKCPYSTLANRMSRYFNIVLKRSELTGLKVYKSSIYYYMILEYGRILTTSELQEYLSKHNLKLSLSSSYKEQEIMYNKLVEQGLL